jgi:hypothetical protein
LFLGNILGFAMASAFGKAAPRGWVRVEAGPDVDRLFQVSVPPGEHPAAQLSDGARQALVKASVHAWCFSAAPGGFTVLWFKQSLGQDTEQALAQAAALLPRLLT